MRLVTRSDFDGLVCGVLLKEVEQIDSIEFVHPKDVQDGKVQVGPDDILTNLPYQPNIGMWFDHHASEATRNDMDGIEFRGRFDVAPSAARVVYDYYVQKGQGDKLARFDALLRDVDRSDAADLTMEDVTDPKGWILLSYVLDPRTGLGYHRSYTISNLQLMNKMIDWIREYDVESLLAMPDIKQRVDRYREQEARFKEVTQKHSRVDGNVIITDLRGVEDMPTGNRFLVYTLFPEANVQVRIFDGRGKEKVVAAVGHSIFNRTCSTDIGNLMGQYDGGGHRGAGTCQLLPEEADEKISEIVETLKKNG